MSTDVNLNIENINKTNSLQAKDDADPGVISDDDEFAVNMLNHYQF